MTFVLSASLAAAFARSASHSRSRVDAVRPWISMGSELSFQAQNHSFLVSRIIQMANTQYTTRQDGADGQNEEGSAYAYVRD